MWEGVGGMESNNNGVGPSVKRIDCADWLCGRLKEYDSRNVWLGLG